MKFSESKSKLKKKISKEILLSEWLQILISEAHMDTELASENIFKR